LWLVCIKQRLTTTTSTTAAAAATQAPKPNQHKFSLLSQ